MTLEEAQEAETVAIVRVERLLDLLRSKGYRVETVERHEYLPDQYHAFPRGTSSILDEGVIVLDVSYHNCENGYVRLDERREHPLVGVTVGEMSGDTLLRLLT